MKVELLAYSFHGVDKDGKTVMTRDTVLMKDDMPWAAQQFKEVNNVDINVFHRGVQVYSPSRLNQRTKGTLLQMSSIHWMLQYLTKQALDQMYTSQRLMKQKQPWLMLHS